MPTEPNKELSEMAEGSLGSPPTMPATVGTAHPQEVSGAEAVKTDGSPAGQAEKEGRPLITFALLAFNQERFIREAVKGAFSQTYSPLEIILSDDCSTDQTFEIMKEMAEVYSGSHTTILNRNEHNLGLGGHVNRVMEIAKGVLIVGAAGDDISLPHRVERTWEAWRQCGCKPCSVYSPVTVIDEHGVRLCEHGQPLPSFADDLPRMCSQFMPEVIGASHAWHRSAFEVFGPLDPKIVYEDRAIPFRSVLLGKLTYVPEPLVIYRTHPASISRYGGKGDIVRDYRRFCVTHAQNRLTVVEQWRRDLSVWPEATIECEGTILSCLARAQFDVGVEALRFHNRLIASLKALRMGVDWRYVICMFLRRAITPYYSWWIRRYSSEIRNYWERLAASARENTDRTKQGR